MNILSQIVLFRKSHVFTWVCVGVGADGGSVNGSDGDGGTCYPNMPICLPCWPGCPSCQDGTPCRVQEAWLLRAGVLAVQGVFMFLIFVSMLVAYRHRRNRVSQGLFGSAGPPYRWDLNNQKSCSRRCATMHCVSAVDLAEMFGVIFDIDCDHSKLNLCL